MIDLVAGARPNFVKLAPLLEAIRRQGELTARLVHTGQHYDEALSRVFFDDLEIPSPDVNLSVGSATQGAQTARILERYEAQLLASRPRATLVIGDVNGTLACALAAAKLQIPVVHVEAGLRSFDRTMPEEVNRVLTDALSDLLFVTEASGVTNLRREGIAEEKIRWVGNLMIDSLHRRLPVARRREVCRGLGLEPGSYGVVTLHRPSNVDDPRTLTSLLVLLDELAETLPLLLPLHPRTASQVERLPPRPAPAPGGVRVLEPLSYLDFLGLLADSRLVLTDSGGIQEEAAALGLPCLTLRETTERPVTVELGTSRLVGNDPAAIRGAFEDACSGRWPAGQPIPLWDGKAADRIVGELTRWMAS